MKITKGEAGYIRARKMTLFARAAISFGLVAALVIVGYVTTKTKLNLLTVVAVLGCLPAARILTGAITIAPHKSIDGAKKAEIDEKTSLLTTAFDTVLTSYEKIMPLDAIVISGHTIYCYSHSDKLDLNYTTSYIRRTLNKNGFPDLNVKVFREYNQFIARVEGLNSMAEVSKQETGEAEEQMRQVLLNVSL